MLRCNSDEGKGTCAVVPLMWWHRFIGTPYVKGGRGSDGLDCWGVVLASFAAFHPEIVLPGYGAVTVDDVLAVARAIRGEKRSGTWIEIETGLERAFDIGVMPAVAASGRDDFHVGIVTRPGHVMHSEECVGVTEMRFRDEGPYRANPYMRFRRVTIYRHKDLA